MEDGDVPILLTSRKVLTEHDELSDKEFEIICMEDIPGICSTYDESLTAYPSSDDIGKNDLAYCIYTSGSTGALAFLFQGFNEFSSAYFTGLNNGKVSAIIAFSKTFIIQTAAIMLLPMFLGIEGLWLAQAVAEFTACLVGLYFYITHKHEYTGY